MTDSAREHALFDELAAGHALHALDPQDEQRFLRHLPDCARCQAAVGDFTEVAAALSEDWSTMEPSPQLGRRIMAAIAKEPRRPAIPGQERRLGQPGPPGRPDQPGQPDRLDQRGPPGQAGRPGQASGAPEAGRSSAGSPSGPAPADDARPPATVGDLSAQRSRHRRRRPRSLAAAISAAAAVVAIGAGAVWGGLAAASGGHQAPRGSEQLLAACVSSGACRQVVLTGERSQATSARVVIDGDAVWLIPSSLPADDAARRVYVLWQITGAHTPLAVGSFDVAGHRNTPVRIGRLAVSYHSTWAFAVSLEHGRTIPATPSHPVALGQVPS